MADKHTKLSFSSSIKNSLREDAKSMAKSPVRRRSKKGQQILEKLKKEEMPYHGRDKSLPSSSSESSEDEEEKEKSEDETSESEDESDNDLDSWREKSSNSSGSSSSESEEEEEKKKMKKKVIPERKEKKCNTCK